MDLSPAKTVVVMTAVSLLIGVTGLVGCQPEQQAVLQLQAHGHTYPKDFREKIIFDYFQAIKTEQYQLAYSLISPTIRGHYAEFVADRKNDRRYLPIAIALGEAHQSEDGSYSYPLYQIVPDRPQPSQGRVLLMPSVQHPGTWYITYNSAF
jgi:hypothetical protein